MNTPFESIGRGVVVGGHALQSSLNAKRLRVLIRRKNPLFSDVENDDPLVGAESVFYCLTLTSDQLSSMYGETQEQWDARVAEFAESLEDGALEEFAELLKVEDDAIKEATVEPIDSGKEEAPEATTTGRNHIGSMESLSPQCHPGCLTPMPSPNPSSPYSDYAMPRDAKTGDGIGTHPSEKTANEHCKTF